MGQALSSIRAAEVSIPVLRPERDEEPRGLEDSYRQAVALLRHIKALGRTWSRSENPGRRAAGEEIITLLERR